MYVCCVINQKVLLRTRHIGVWHFIFTKGSPSELLFECWQRIHHMLLHLCIFNLVDAGYSMLRVSLVFHLHVGTCPPLQTEATWRRSRTSPPCQDRGDRVSVINNTTIIALHRVVKFPASHFKKSMKQVILKIHS